MINRKQQWDAFRSKPRVIREAANSHTNWTIYILQCLKLAIYFFSHLFIIVGSFISKSTVLILSTNLNTTTMKHATFHKKCGTNTFPENENHEFEVAILLCLLIIQLLPDFFAILHSAYQLLRFSSKDFRVFKLVAICETLRCAGLSIFLFIVFPKLDITHCCCLLCANVYFPYLSEFILVFADKKRTAKNRFIYSLKVLPHAVMISVCLGAAFLWGMLGFNEDNKSLPFAMLLYGIGNWETWIAKNHCEGVLKELFRLKYGLRKLNFASRIVISFLRILTVIGCASYAVYWNELKPQHFWTFLNISELSSETYHLIALALALVVLNFLIRLSVRFLAAMKMQLINVFHPALILPPLLIVLSYEACHKIPMCFINKLLKPFAFNFSCLVWKESDGFDLKFAMSVLAIACYVFWCYNYLSKRKMRKMDEIIDSLPIFLNGCAIESTITVFRHVIGKRDILDELEDDTHVGPLKIINSEIDKTMTLYVCATCWHETRNEMIQMIKSIMKLDEEHALRLGEKNQNVIKFRLEVHIFFDDAWENDAECGRIPNEYFKLLFELLMELTASSTDNPTNEPWSRILANTSYGGRLVVKLPAGTLLFVHLKDKQLIRHKKRWSQVMYMYYLLGHRIMDSHLSVEDRQLQADNTYILAIDGDSKFEPEAVVKLLHLMNTKSDIGCACGRIHPIGDGVMVWYQKFEYAIAHWFQKAAEHVFGCVLCAPGCFSLFRASALMDDNIMHKYTKTAYEPRHYVQYDQGEDRWLSTLMLKQGYRIEYAAGADAETYAPEGFDEFFNQRRRWTPSSVANTIDLLADYKLACQNNSSISKLYIFYQMLVIGFSLLGPAIIFTMLVYAQVAAFGMDSLRVLVYNAVPVCIFIFSCFVFDSKVQLFFAKISSIVYAFIMLAVLIATTQQVVLETIFSPTSMFVLAMVLIFLFASFIHPKEFSNILYGSIFFLMIPSTYVFLSLYSLINLNVINWGTREAVAKATGKAVASDKVGEKWVKRLGFDNDDSIIYRMLPCLRPPQPSSENVRALERKMERTERLLKNLQKDNDNTNAHDAVSMLNIIAEEERRLAGKKSEAIPFRTIDLSDKAKSLVTVDALGQTRRGLWMDCEYLQSCDRGKLKQSEERFWDQLIDKYLRPIESTPKEQSNIASGLVALRNRIAFSIIILNGLLVLAIFLLQRHKDVLSIKYIPYEGFQWTKMNETTGKFGKTTEALKVDPLGMGIIFFLMGILIVQTFGMIIHRLNTLVESLHEVSEMEEVHFESSTIKSKSAVLNEARQMIDAKNYERAHGADGYVRNGKMEQKYLNNVLYKLEREDENKQLPRRAKRII